MKKNKQSILPLIVSMIVVAAVAGVLGSLTMASASGTGDQVCVPQEAQHYSWTGGRRATDNPPTEVPPSDNWQPNTHLEPHTQGGGHPATWVNESLHYTANSQGHASWFYFTPEVKCETPSTEPPTEPPVTEPTTPVETTTTVTEPTTTTATTTQTTETTSTETTSVPPSTTTSTVTNQPPPVTLIPPTVSVRPPAQQQRKAPAPVIPTEIDAGL